MQQLISIMLRPMIMHKSRIQKVVGCLSYDSNVTVAYQLSEIARPMSETRTSKQTGDEEHPC